MTPEADGPAPLPPRDEAQHQTPKAIVAALRLLWKSGETREVRLLDVQGRGRPHTASGCFRDPKTAVTTIQDWERKGAKYGGIYLTINPAQDDCHARAADRIDDWPKNTTGDAEIVARHHLLVV